MSAYVHRLLQRFAGPRAEQGPRTAPRDPRPAGLQPFVRSRSPIATLDQRLAIDDQPSFGLDGGNVGAARSGEGDGFALPSPAGLRIQRKALGASPVAASPVPASPVAASPSAAGSAAARPIATSKRGNFRPASASSPALEPGSRREPMDPGPLFDHFDSAPRDFEPGEVSEPSAPTALSTPQRVSQWVPQQPLTLEAEPVHAFDRNGLEPGEARHSPRSPLTPVAFEPGTPGAPRPAPWRILEPAQPARPHAPPFAPSPSERPLEPAPQRLPIPPELREQPVVSATPRPSQASPFITDPGPRVATSVAQATRVSIGRVEIEVVPSPSSSAAATPAAGGQAAKPGKLTIDSVSLIGPLDRHFPNRRRFRLRYR